MQLALWACPSGPGSTVFATYASALIASGCSVRVVQSYLGHTSAAVTLNVYSHLWAEDDDRARSAVETFFSGAVSSVCHDEATG